MATTASEDWMSWGAEQAARVVGVPLIRCRLTVISNSGPAIEGTFIFNFRAGGVSFIGTGSERQLVSRSPKLFGRSGDLSDVAVWYDDAGDVGETIRVGNWELDLEIANQSSSVFAATLATDPFATGSWRQRSHPDLYFRFTQFWENTVLGDGRGVLVLHGNRNPVAYTNFIVILEETERFIG